MIKVYYSPIFTTTQNELGKTQLSLNNKYDSLFTQKSVLSDDDIKGLQAYNAELSRTSNPTTAFNRTLIECSDAAQNMAMSANGAAVDLSQIPKQSKAGQMALQGLASAGNMVAGALIGMAISKGIELLDHWINRQEYAKEALADSVSAYDAVTNEVNSLQESLTTCRDRLSQLQSLAANGTITLVEQKELDSLQKQNDELERQVALKQADQIDAQKETLEDIDDVVNGKVASRYQTVSVQSTSGQMYAPTAYTTASYAKSVTRDEELISAVDEYNKYSNLQQENPDTDYSTQLDSASERIKEMYSDISPAIEAYDKLIASGSKLTNEEQARYEQLKKSQEAYLQYNYTLNGTKEAFEALTEEQQRTELKNRLTDSGISDEQADSILNSMSANDISKLWNKDIPFIAPKSSNYKSTEAYERAYADSLLNSAKKENSIYGENASFDQIWAGIDEDDNSIFKNLKSELTSLAEKGQLTLSAFEETDDSANFLDQIGLSAEEAVKKINNLTDRSQQLGTLKSTISSLQDAYSEKSKNGIVGADTLSSMSKTFGNLGDSWTKYEQIAGSVDSTTEDLQKAQDELATAYINSNNFLSGLVDETGKCTKANKQYYISQLEGLGIKNAEEIVNNSILQQKANLAVESLNLANATPEEINALAMENQKLGESNEAFKNYIFYKALASQNALDTTGSIQNLINLAKECESTGEVIYHLTSLLNAKEGYEQFIKSGGDINDPANTYYQHTIEYETNWLNKNADKNTNKNKNNVNITPTEQGANTAFSTKQEIDWIDRRVAVLTSKISLLNAQKENLFTVKKKNTNLKEQIKQTTKLIKTYSAAYKEYMNKANAVGLSSNLKKKVQNGQITGNHKDLIKEYGEDTAKDIESYKKYYDLAQSSKQSLAEAKTSKRELRIERLQNYVDKYDARADYNELRADNTTLSVKKRNKAINNEIKNVKNSYKKQIKIADLSGDSTEMKRLKEERKQKVNELKIQKNQNYVDKYNALADYNELMAGNTSLSATTRNNYIDKEISNLKKSYEYQFKIAKLNKDTTEQKRLQEEYQQKLVGLSKQQFDNIANEYEKKIQVLGYSTSQYDNKIAEIEASGAKVNRSYYNAKKTVNSNIMSQYNAELAALEKELPNIKNGTDEYYEALDAIQACKDAISECTQNTYELNNSINQLHFDAFNDEAERLNRIITEQDFLQGLFSHENMTVDETGDFTEAGLSKLGSLSTSYYAAKEKTNNDTAEVKELQKMMDTGSLKSDVLDIEFNSVEDLQAKLDEMYTQWQNDITETYEIESKIADAMKDKYQAELNSLQDLIDAKKDALQSEKDLHDYQKTITEKAKDISTLQKQITAYSGDTSQEGFAKLQKLQKELAEKEEDLRETEYERYISDQEEILDKLYDEYEELVTKKLDDFMTLVQDGLDTANANSAIANAYISSLMKHYGYTGEFDQNGIFNVTRNSSTAKTSKGTESSNTANSKTQSDNLTKQVIDNGDTSFVSVKNGEGFLTPENVVQIQNLLNTIPLVNNLSKSLINQLSLPDAPLKNTGNNIEAIYNFTLENCNNAEDIIYQIQTSSKIQKALQSVTVDRIAGGTRLGVQSIK